MSEQLWHIYEHIIPASHIRGYDRGVRDNGNPWLRLSVKQYVPKRPTVDLAISFTIVVAHGTGAAKELFEIYFDELIEAGTPIRSIWIADSAASGASFALNNELYGDEISWLDYPRDIWTMINHFQREMPPPIIGIGHSLGAGAISTVSTWHPRLFEGLVLLEPAVGPKRDGMPYPAPAKFFPGVVAATRKDRWPSRDEARQALKKTRHYGAFDSRVLEKVIQYEIKNDEPIVGNPPQIPVTLATPKYIESAHWMIPYPPLPHHIAPPEAAGADVATQVLPGFHRGDGVFYQLNLPAVFPPVLLSWGSKSVLTPPYVREWYRENTGTGFGGNGGVSTGAVEEVTIQGAGHNTPMEAPKKVAHTTHEWLEKLKRRIERAREAKKLQLPFRNETHPEIMAKIAKL